MSGGRGEVIVVGAGPAGVAAARSLVERGVATRLLLGVGMPESASAPSDVARDRLEVLASEPDPRRWLGSDLAGLDPALDVSPKFRLPWVRRDLEEYRARYGVRAPAFSLAGSVRAGGSSQVWGAGVSRLDATDMQGWPVSSADMAAAFEWVERWVPISGERDALGDWFGPSLLQPSTPMEPAASALYGRVQGSAPGRLRLGRGRNAVRTASDEPRRCDQLGRCLWGCPHGAIWSADQEIAGIRRAGGQVEAGWVRSLHRRDGGWVLTGEANGRARQWRSAQVILAAGAVGSAALASTALTRKSPWERPLRCHPVAGFALLVPSTLGAAFPRRFFGLTQLAFVLHQQRADASPIAYGNLFPAASVDMADMIVRMPVSVRTARTLTRELAPSMLVGNAFVGAEFASHRVRISQGRPPRVEIVAGSAAGADVQLTRVRRSLAVEFARLGAWMAPGSFTRTPAGADAHYIGTLPMRERPAEGECDGLGALQGAPGVHVADGAALPSMGLKPPTLGIMAHAHRVAAGIADRLALDALPSK